MQALLFRARCARGHALGAAIFAVVQELTVGGLSLTSFTSGQSAIAMPQPHPSAHYERARGTDVINVTDRSRVGTVFLTNIFVKGWGSLPTALSTTPTLFLFLLQIRSAVEGARSRNEV